MDALTVRSIATQTFLPYADFDLSASVLDRARLGNQRTEVLTMLRTLSGYSDGYRNHAAVKMWVGYVPALSAYGVAICKEWVRRGYKDYCRGSIEAYGGTLLLPPWFGDKRLHSSHRAALLYKDQAWYSQYGWSETPQLCYWWPTKGWVEAREQTV